MICTFAAVLLVTSRTLSTLVTGFSVYVRATKAYTTRPTARMPAFSLQAVQHKAGSEFSRQYITATCTFTRSTMIRNPMQQAVPMPDDYSTH
jgi:hypothetical protein